MAETSIEWADFTFNPWVGCQRVSPGCQRCYAEAYDKRVGGAPARLRKREGVPQLRWGPNAERTRTTLSYWKQPLKWNAAMQAGKRRRVFCASLADVFDLHESIDHAWRLELFSLIRQTQALDWLLLTKRPENFKAALEGALAVSARHNGYMKSPEAFEATRLWVHRWLNGDAPRNVWMGTTAEDQIRADERTRALTQVPAVLRFLSVEPLLEPVRLPLEWHTISAGTLSSERIDWVIIGGESGGKARPFDVAWARAVLRQARNAGASPFVKQLGANVRTRNDDSLVSDFDEGGWFLDPLSQIEEDVHGYREDHQGAEVRIRLRDSAGGDMAEWPLDLRVREFPEVRHG